MVTYDGLLRSPTESGYLFYGLILLTLLVKLRPWRRLGAGPRGDRRVRVRRARDRRAISASAVARRPAVERLDRQPSLHNWVIVPANPTRAGNIGFVLLICLLIALVQVKGRWRTILMVPTLYLAAFVWESRLVAEPSITRQLLIGAILIVMMNARPQGLLGRRRVEAST